MKKLTIVTALITTLLISITASAMDEHGKYHETKKMQETCPVMGGKINKNLYADVNGKRIYVCCPECVRKIKADPNKYIKALENSGVTLDEAPAAKHKKNNQNFHNGNHH